MMTPSRIGNAGGAASYYGRDDYYVTGEAGAPGIEWGGQGAAALGLSGLASTDDFRAVLEGRNPDPDGPALTSASGKEKHHAGWDFTFTVPKSVSLAIVAAERADPALAERLQSAVLSANTAMMKYLEDNHAVTRVRGEGGAIREVQTGNLVYASVLHRTTRGGDPHFHVHNPTANATRNPETGQWGALETRHMYKWQKVASQVGARELQAALMKEGFNIERHGELKWEIAGANPKLLTEFSQRSTEIEAGAQKLSAERGGEITLHQRNMVQKQTRKNKEAHDRDALAEAWQSRAAALGGPPLDSLLERGGGPGRDVTPTLVGRMSPMLQQITTKFRELTGGNLKTDAFDRTRGGRADPDQEARRLMSFGVKVVEEQHAAASKHLAFSHALQAAPAGVTYDRLERAMDRLRQDGHVRVADAKWRDGITTERMVRTERAILSAVENGKGAMPALMDKAAVEKAILTTSVGAQLTETQYAAVAGLWTSQDKYRAIPGFAGVGKTFAFQAVREMAEARGQRVHGLSTVNRHVQEFRSGSGIEAQTIASWLTSVERAERRGGDALASERAKWSGVHLIIDEASTVTNESAWRLTRAVDVMGVASVTIAGDKGQTGGPGAGNVFKAVLDRGIQQFPITEIQRQRDAAPHLREGVRDLAEGRLREGMAKLAPNVHEVGREAADVDLARRAVELWTEHRKAGHQSVLIVPTHKMRALQSSLARRTLQEEMALGADNQTRERLSAKHMTKAEKFNAASYAPGDILVSSSAFGGAGPSRGDRATVVGIDLQNNLLKTTSGTGRTATVDLNKAHARQGKDPGFSVYTLGTHEVATGEQLVWEARFKDRGYEPGAAFTVLSKGERAWTIQHQDGRKEKISANDPALGFTSYGYAVTYERAQGMTIEAPVHTLPTNAGQAVAETKNYVGWSRLTKTADLVTDDVPRLMLMLAQNDGQKAVALDHVRELWDKIQAKLEKDRASKKELGPTDKPAEQKDLNLQKGLEAPGQGGDGGRERQRSKTNELTRRDPGLSL